MKEIKYTLTSRGAFLTEIDTKNSDTVLFKIDGEDEAILKIGEKTYEISHGVCYIRPVEIRDGVYVPELITDVGATKLDTFSVFYGVMKLEYKEAEYLNTSKILLELSSRLNALEEKTRALWDAVFGTKLF